MTKSADVAAVLAVRKAAPAAAPVVERASKPKPLTLAQRIDKVQGSVVQLRGDANERLSVLEDAWDEAFADMQKSAPLWVQVFSFVVASGVAGGVVTCLVYAALQ